MASVWWVRRDARLHDNPALLEAQRIGATAAVFPWSPPLVHWSGRRRAYLARSLWSLRHDTGGRAAVRQGSPTQTLVTVAREINADAVWAQREYAPSAVREQDAVGQALADAGVELHLVGSPYAVAPGQAVKADGTEYRVFTPYLKAWRRHGWRSPAPAADPEALMPLEHDVDLDLIAAQSDGVDPLGFNPPFTETEWLGRLDDFVEERLAHYEERRDRPDLDGTSHLSIPLAFGQIHPRTILATVSAAVAREPGLASAAEKFMSELAWRDFHADVLYHHPRALRESLTPVVPDDSWASGPQADAAFNAWRDGQTGFPLVDAGMRELAATGTMHNRVRMVVASFLVKDLHLPWQRGADHFRRAELDYDHAQNQLNWQWVAGTGRDAAPYFRIFNPEGQRTKHDPESAYVRRWLPDLDTPAYPQPIVDHAAEREVALAAYQRRRSQAHT